MTILPHLFLISLLLASVHADIETYYQSQKFENGNIGPWPSQHFISSNIRAPVPNFVRYGQLCRDGLHTFIAPRGSDVYTPGPMILDQDGHLVWFKPMGQTYNMNVQTFKGQDYLTFWSGDDSIVGHGEGTYFMVSRKDEKGSSYKRYKTNSNNSLIKHTKHNINFRAQTV